MDYQAITNRPYKYNRSVFDINKFILSAFADEAAAGLDGQIAALKRNNIPNIEIRNVDAKYAASFELPKIKEMSSQLKDNNIGISAIGSPIGKIQITDPFRPHLDLLEKTLEAAEILGAKRIRMFSFFIPKDENAAIYKDEVFKRLDRILELSEKAGVKCCHENEKDIYGDTAERNLELFSAFKGRLNCIFDPANYIQCGESPGDIFDGFLPYLDSLHIKDASMSDKSVKPAGLGDGRIKELLQKLGEKTGDIYLTLEPHLTVFPGFANLSDEVSIQNDNFKTTDEAFDFAAKHMFMLLNN